VLLQQQVAQQTKGEQMDDSNPYSPPKAVGGARDSSSERIAASGKCCPGCGETAETVFVLTNVPLRLLRSSQVTRFVHTAGADLFENKWWQKLIPRMAEYVLGHRCDACKFLTIDYGKKFSEKEVHAIVRGDSPSPDG
jgi:hypothetical protein